MQSPQVIATRFHAKVVTLDKAKDLNKLTLDDLLGSLTTYDMNTTTQSKDKGLALKAEVSLPNNTVYSKMRL